MRHTQQRGTIVSPVPITLRVVSPQLPGLSMVDMPGLTKVPIDGQPKSIVQELETMARDYVKHENVIILAVTPANADLATSDALRLAREVDPTGERTIGKKTAGRGCSLLGREQWEGLCGEQAVWRELWASAADQGHAPLIPTHPRRAHQD